MQKKAKPLNTMAVDQQTVEQSKDEYISVPEAASLLRLSDKSIRRLLTEKRLTRFKVGAASVKSRTLLLRAEVVALIHKA
jgi:excisionase family DNA binding protein